MIYYISGRIEIFTTRDNIQTPYISKSLDHKDNISSLVFPSREKSLNHRLSIQSPEPHEYTHVNVCIQGGPRRTVARHRMVDASRVERIHTGVYIVSLAGLTRS